MVRARRGRNQHDHDGGEHGEDHDASHGGSVLPLLRRMAEDGQMADADARRATTDDREAVVGLLVRGFAIDPLVRWFFPDDATYPARAGAFFGYLFDIRVEHGEVYVASDGGAASLWTPPDGVTMSTSEQDRRWADQVEVDAGPGELARVDGFDEAVAAMTPADPHWYLGVLATDPSQRHRGLATAVLRPVLERANRDDMPVFLETAADNLPFYARFGFEALAAADLPGGPTVHALWRTPTTS
jgi:ribosomal protein S18 acetylase RimI-like enzyme